MSLRPYRMPRMVVLSPTSSVLEAARAIESNHIGAVVIQDKRQVVGIVTDRDLAVRVVSQGLDANATPIADVMSSPVATLSPSDSQADAIRIMRQRNIRRVPLAEDGRVVGIVTLDDLLLDEAASLDQLAGVIAAQIGEGGPVASPNSPAARRRMARAQATYGRLINQLCFDADLETSQQAESLLLIVLESVIQRLTPDEAEDLIAQLPSLLHPVLRSLPPGPDKRINRQFIESRIAEEPDLDPERAGELLQIVAATMAQTVSPGQIRNVRGQLPADLAGIFPDDSGVRQP